MHPQTPFCHHQDCPARGQVRVHSRAEPRSQRTTCGQTLAATKGTPFYRLRTAADVVTVGRTLLSHGGPIPAIVAAFGLDERTVAAWRTRAGQHCRQVQQHLVPQGHVDLQPVQAEEMWGKRVGHREWMARALAVPSRP
jgi:transposase-like protein